MALNITERHTYPRSPITKEIKNKLLGIIKTSDSKEELLADDILELLYVMRNDKDGYLAVNRFTDKLVCEYAKK